MSGFLGEYEVTLDAKGRFLVPTDLKRQIGEENSRFVMNRGFDRCLVLYPIKTWEPLFEKVSTLNQFDPKVRAFRRFFLNGATPVEYDSAGRLLVPQGLKEYAGLEKEIILATDVDKIEVWDKSKHKQLFETFSPDDYSKFAGEVMGNTNN